MLLSLINYSYTRFATLLLTIIIFNVILISVCYFGGIWHDSSTFIFPSPKNYNDGVCTTNQSCEHSVIKSIKEFAIKMVYPVKNEWKNLPNKMDHLDLNLIYKNFNIPKPKAKSDIDIIFIVSSAPTRIERRMGIRNTWWEDCKSSANVSILCYFLTDEKEDNSTLGKSLLEESDRYKDIKFQNLQGGFDFGKRFLYHMLWAMTNFNFKYFLRLDDDYFMCMKRFLLEIPMPPPPLYHWGWVHCIEDIVRPEESIILLSRDLIEVFLGQDPNQMLCHRWADQMIGVWKDELKLSKLYYNHDTRLHHNPPAQFVEEFKTRENICDDFIGVHGSYASQMRVLWKHRGREMYASNNKTFLDFSSPCQYPNVMKWQNFGVEFNAKPMLCKNNPDWGGHHGTAYTGRQGAG